MDEVWTSVISTERRESGDAAPFGPSGRPTLQSDGLTSSGHHPQSLTIFRFTERTIEREGACEVLSMKSSVVSATIEKALPPQIGQKSSPDAERRIRVAFEAPPEYVADIASMRASFGAGDFPVVAACNGKASPRRVAALPLSKRKQREQADDAAGKIDRRSLLSPRETEVLALLAEGLPNKHIGRSLGIAEPTVKCHVKAVLRKLNVRNRFEAAMWVLRARGQLRP